MPTPTLDEVSRVAAAFGLVAAAAVPLGLAAWGLARWRREPVLPPCRRWTTSLSGYDVLGLFVLAVALPPVGYALFDQADAAGAVAGFPRVVPDAVQAAAGSAAHPGTTRHAAERRFWTDLFGRAVALPAFLLAWYVVYRVATGRPIPRAGWRRGQLAGNLAAGVLTWAVVTIITFLVYFAVLWVQERLGGTADEHTLSQAGVGESVGRVVLFFVSACVLAPLGEELLFRRILLPWAVGRTYRPWLLLGGAGVLAVILPALTSEPRAGPSAFLGVLVVGLILLQQSRAVLDRVRVHTAGGVYATAALFGLMHAQVWPTPIPLFVLGLGLGCVAVRTRSVWPAVVAHGLFNAVSSVYLLRGGAG